MATDLIPLTSEEPDPRLDSVKQWLVRLDHLKRSDGISSEERETYGALFNRIFQTFETLATGVELKPAGVNPQTGEITIETKDGPVPFESLSQGTLSLVGWTGVLMQRLYETAPEDIDPMTHRAIVLVDEIDAHMHPSWQQTLIQRLSETFTSTQFIVTSHSPLVVGGLEPTQVYRFARDARGAVQISQPDYPLKGLGAAGLLTSGLFGLASHLDTSTAKALDRKRQLTAKQLAEALEPPELKELGELEEEVAYVDFTQAVRDPLYRRFVDAVARVESRAGQVQEVSSAPLTAEEEEAKARVAEEIVKEILEDSVSSRTSQPKVLESMEGAQATPTARDINSDPGNTMS